VHLKKRIYMVYIIVLGVLNVIGCGVEKDVGGTSGSAANDGGSVTLSWKAPYSDANGSNLNDLAGYKIYYGMSSKNYTRSLDVGHYTEAVISSLSPGMWCFTVTAYDVSGNESKYSNEMCKVI
jgi:hypothetical protein